MLRLYRCDGAGSTFKMKYFERHWQAELLELARPKIRAFYNKYLKEDENTQILESTSWARVNEAVKHAVAIKQ